MSGALLAGPVAAEESTADRNGGGSWLPATPSAWNLVVDKTTTPTMTITQGVTERSETLDAVSGRQPTQVMDVDLTDPNVRLGVVEAGDTLTYPADETIGSMAARTHAVAGVNGDYFEINASGRPLGGVITEGRVLKSPRPNYNAQLGVRADGSMVIGPQTYAGTVADGTASSPLASVNVVNDEAAGQITRITPALGATALAAPATLVTGHLDGTTLVVDAVSTGVTSLPAGIEGLAGGGTGGAWLASTAHVGDRMAITERISPDNDLKQLLSGATQLVKDGAVYTDPTGTPPSGVNPETAVGLSKDGRHAFLVTLDGRTGETTALGVTPAQVAGYLVQLGAYSALLLDGGGSTEMIGRKPGGTKASVLNTPSDGKERAVANGLFVYSTASAPGSATSVVVNGGKPVTTVRGGSIDVPVYAIDQRANPAAGSTSVQVLPPGLADWSGGKLTVHHPGLGVIIARNGRAVSTQPLRAVSRLGSLSVSPAQVDLTNGVSRQFSLSGKTSTGEAGSVLGADRQPSQVDIPTSAAHWSVNPPELGTISADGLFTAAATGVGLATLTATVGNATAAASVAVGSRSKVVADLSDVANWRLRNTTGMPATMSLGAGPLPPGIDAPGSLQLTYTVPAGPGVKQLVFWDNNDITIGADGGANPTAIGLWVNGDRNGLILHEQYVQINGQATALAETTVTWQGWRFYTAQVPPATQFPLSLNYLDFLAVNPSTTVSGTLQVSGLTALYSPRPVANPPYVAIPHNPSWLQYTEDSARFSRSGNTLLAGDDAHLLANDPGSASRTVIRSIADRLPTLPDQARPTVAQFLGDMSDDGLPVDLAYAKDTMGSLGLPFRDAVGNHEISQGALPENGNFTAAFGDTHYAYQFGAAQVIVTDSAHGGLLSSDKYGVPAEAQYPWLVAQLSATTSRAVAVVTHMPAYDPHPVANSQFGDRWEAKMYVRLIQRYQQTHPDRHVIMVYGHSRGFAEQTLDPGGMPTDPAHGGIPQLTIADLGMPPYAPPEQGGFYNFALLHVTGDGGFQFSVEPVLASIGVTAPQPTLPVGGAEQLTASGTAVGGDNQPPLVMPIADPASHVWSSSNSRVATVDARTGMLTAHRPGTVVVSVTSGGITGSVTVTVS
ncbi:phosphodiester glycosidase family protein [Kutzneria sp. NPDC052558]|uniref:phosphodiester glycosidase family protein n=1 Tax=Kutzneria sp. NPDC052558 TaxID=3364121 RepID=UPI0037C925A2